MLTVTKCMHSYDVFLPIGWLARGSFWTQQCYTVPMGWNGIWCIRNQSYRLSRQGSEEELKGKWQTWLTSMFELCYGRLSGTWSRIFKYFKVRSDVRAQCSHALDNRTSSFRNRIWCFFKPLPTAQPPSTVLAGFNQTFSHIFLLDPHSWVEELQENWQCEDAEWVSILYLGCHQQLRWFQSNLLFQVKLSCSPAGLIFACSKDIKDHRSVLLFW